MHTSLRLIAVAALAVTAGTAIAHADGTDPAPRHGSLKDAPVAIAATNWSGCYGGVAIGGAWGDFKNRTSTYDKLNAGEFGTGNVLAQRIADGGAADIDPGYYFSKPGDTDSVNGVGSQKAHGDSVIGGGTLGCNLQSGKLVLGFEGDLSAMNIRGKASSTGPYAAQPGQTFTINSDASANGLFTFRGRVGVASDNWLFFGTAGLAVTNQKANFSFTDTNVTALETASFNKTVAGFAIGAGAEVMLGRGWSLKGEYLHLGFGKVSVSSNNFAGFAGATYVSKPETYIDHSSKLDADIFRVGINRKF